jgi:CelD/BcsL family acetyltransferase involved in cellulose biosynthesis
MTFLSSDRFLRLGVSHDGIMRDKALSTALAARRATHVTTRIVTLPEMMDQLADWQQLAAVALESNIFQDPAFLASALLHIPEGPMPQFVVITQPGSDHPVWIGVVCLWRHGLDLGAPVLRGWQSRQSALGTPLLHQDHADLAMDALLDWLIHDADTPNVLLPMLRMDGPFVALLEQHAQARHISIEALASHQRAVLHTGLDVADYGLLHLRGKKLKELRRLRNRLADIGPLRFDDLVLTIGVNPAIEQFLILEAQGWKGQLGTALVQEPGRAAFARATLRSLAAKGRLSIYGLFAGEQTVAIGLVMIHLDRAYFWKIAINETLAPLSPGVLFVQSLTETLLESRGVAVVDSCANADHAMIDHLWKQRQPMADLLLCAHPKTFSAALLRRKEHVRRKLRAKAKQLFHLLRGKSRIQAAAKG